MSKLILKNSQIKALKAIAGKPAITRKQLSTVAFGGNSVNFVPILEPMVKAKLISQKELDIDGKKEITFSATAAGVALSKKVVPADRGAAKHEALPKVGGSFTKNYKGKDFTIKVVAEGFKIGATTYPSLTAAAQAIRDSKSAINGWAFFGLVKAKAE